MVRPWAVAGHRRFADARAGGRPPVTTCRSQGEAGSYAGIVAREDEPPGGRASRECRETSRAGPVDCCRRHARRAKLATAVRGHGRSARPGALTELQIAWKADETARLLDGTGLLSAWRSAWAIATASRLVADQPELASLADAVRGRCQPAVPKAVASLKQNPQDLETALAAVYATMTLNDPELRALALAAAVRQGRRGQTIGRP